MKPPERQDERYRIEGTLGKGGMGEVHRAYDTTLGRYVALKVLHSEDHKGSNTDPFRELLREARRCAALQHPNIVTIFDVGRNEDKSTAFIAMELVEGRSLRSAAANPGAPSSVKLGWVREIAQALAAAHAANLVHRDIKPENVIVKADGTIKVLDFGIAKWSSLRAIETGTNTGSMTATGPVIAGTPGYMAPEQALGIVDERSDQFAWGVLAYETLSGKRAPRDRPLLPDEVEANLSPPHLAAVVVRATSRRADDRFPNMRALLEALPPATSIAIPAATAAAAAGGANDTVNELAITKLAAPVASPKKARKSGANGGGGGVNRSKIPIFIGSALMTATIVAIVLFVAWKKSRPTTTTSTDQAVPQITTTPFGSSSPSSSTDASTATEESDDEADAASSSATPRTISQRSPPQAPPGSYVVTETVEPITHIRRRVTLSATGSDVYPAKRVYDACVARVPALKTCFSIHSTDFSALRWWTEVASTTDNAGGFLTVSRVGNVGEALGACVEDALTRKHLDLPLVSSSPPNARGWMTCALISSVVESPGTVTTTATVITPSPPTATATASVVVSAIAARKVITPITDFPGRVGSIRLRSMTSETFMAAAEFDRWRANVEPKLPACLNLPRGECSDSAGSIWFVGTTKHLKRAVSNRRQESMNRTQGKLYCDYPKPVVDCIAAAIATDSIAHHGAPDSEYGIVMTLYP